MDRRNFIGSVGAAVAAALTPGDALARLGFGRGIGRAGGFGPPSSGFYADPYSAYTSYIADTTFSGTAGTNTTVSWNGSTITGPTYSTAQAAINAAAAAGPGSSGTRVCFLKGQTYTVGSTPITIPSTAAFTSSLPFVCQGDPSCTWGRTVGSNTVTTNMPFISGGGGPGNGFFLGYNGTAYVNNDNVVLHKLWIGNFIDSTGTGVSGIRLDGSSPGSYSGFAARYCWLDTFQATGSGGESGPIYVNSSGDTTAFEIGWCKMSNVALPSATGTNQNHAGVGLFGGAPWVHHCEVWNIFQAMHFKTGLCTGTILEKCRLHDLVNFFGAQAGGEVQGYDGVTIRGNLFYWEHLNDTLYGPTSSATGFNDFGSNGNTSIPQNVYFYNNTLSPDIGGYGYNNQNAEGVQFHDNIVLGGIPLTTNKSGSTGTVTACDYNFYFTTGWEMNYEGSPAITFSSFNGASGWQSAHTNNPTVGALTADPDSHGGYIPNFPAGYTTIAENFPGYASFDYTIAPGSPLIGAGTSGANPGYDPSDCGPGW